MAYEWGRFMWWLAQGQNAAAVQALCAVSATITTDKAIWNRIRLVPFNVSIPKDQQDRQLLSKLREEAPGILAWAVRGCLAWQQAGRLTSPAAVQDAVEGYRQEMDLVQDFINEACLLDPTEETPANDLYGAYQRWCEQIRETPQSSTAFGKWLSDHGFQSVRTSSSARKRQGLRLKESVAVLIPLAA